MKIANIFEKKFLFVVGRHFWNIVGVSGFVALLTGIILFAEGSILENPKSKDSSVILGVFLFKDKATYVDLYNETVANSKSNKEIHIDHLIDTAINKKLKVKIEPTEISSMLGTPVEYELVTYMIKALKYLRSQ